MPQLSEYDMECLERARALIEKDLQVRYTVRYLCRVAGMSNTKFRIAFSLYFGMHVFAFAQEKRMQRACALLQDHNYSIKEIARQCGYKHVSHFSRAFKRRYAVTAKRVMKEACRKREK